MIEEKEMHKKGVIIGAGPAALILADKIAPKFDELTVIGTKIGGLLDRVERNGFAYDCGGHVYTLQDERVKELVMQSDGICHERRAIFAYDRFDGLCVDYPVQDSADKLGIPIRPCLDIKTPQNLQTFFIKTFGYPFASKILVPFTTRSLSTHPMHLDYHWIAERVKLPSEEKKDWGMNATFGYAPGDKIIETFLARIRKHSNVKVIEGHVYQVAIKRKEVSYMPKHNLRYRVPIIVYDSLFSSITFPFLDTVSRPFSAVASIGIGLTKKIDLDFHWAYCPLDSPIHRISILSRYHPSNAPSGKDSLLLEIPYLPNQFLSTDLQSILPELKRIGIPISKSDILDYYVRTHYGYPIPMLGVREAVDKEKILYEKKDIYLFGRQGSHGYFNLQHLFTEAEKIAQRFT